MRKLQVWKQLLVFCSLLGDVPCISWKCRSKILKTPPKLPDPPRPTQNRLFFILINSVRILMWFILAFLFTDCHCAHITSREKKNLFHLPSQHCCPHKHLCLPGVWMAYLHLCAVCSRAFLFFSFSGHRSQVEDTKWVLLFSCACIPSAKNSPSLLASSTRFVYMLYSFKQFFCSGDEENGLGAWGT